MTPNKEDYLKCIYEIGEQESKISNKMVAEKMQVSAPAVSEMIKKMISQDWIVKEKGKGYLLTDKGQVLVANLYRKHRLIEVFLIHQLGYNAQEVHQEAEVLEHTVSDTFIDRLDETLGFPTFCPHGGTIPRNGQPLVEINHTTLNTITDLGRFRLSRIHDQFDLIQYLESHGLKINTELELTQIDTFAKTYTIQYLDKELIIPENIAKQLYVTAL
ncbi:metal-dependent transcriptional regulator [Streptococcus dysgalactiae]|uniref:metal-dependent transcriptional regulator n=1 Tax=Streptococcus dysgalactiae TaxID=1334 RepID=UPI0001F86621|nr:metal-dependent transcriptional regulator [Streptococcus dysgalactiae]EFY02183.1 metal-dependent transcriptional regulator [Streptococcus dysgalactiae subsp. dysgalactiae ATCC 27957]MCB2830312.1 metal-dependent transcriptional regulator [Streptococcus dysgalactiae subsp. dysgalactiae]MCB2832353.1 metal-dependent transcriptional regulator [Streptococcus dysgalactiae subsp. dysgalactiae]MCB2836203.1 metal-dependent transcriptional regulator [Streptococcus dysgalactiae subsp. dysgalactiae]MCB2